MKAAQNIYSLLNLYSDYTESGYNKNHTIPDFSFMTIESEIKTVKKEKFPQNNSLKKRKIIELGESILDCGKCGYPSGTKKICGIGNIDAEIFIITDAPTIEEANLGKPLNSEASLFLKKWLAAISFDLNNVFITNIIKCPPTTIKFKKEFIELCLKNLDKELEIINPKIILTLGQITISSLRREYTSLAKSHGALFEYKNIPVIPTYHPAEVLKNTELKKSVWDDLKKFKSVYDGLYQL